MMLFDTASIDTLPMVIDVEGDGERARAGRVETVAEVEGLA